MNPMMTDRGLAQKMIALLQERATQARIAQVRIGLGYTAVELESGAVGVAYTFSDLAKGGCGILHGLRPMTGRPADAVRAWADPWDAVEAGVGIACANALLHTDSTPSLPGDILDHLDLNPEDRVGMVGHFGPVVPPLRQRVGELIIFERTASPAEGILPQEDACQLLPTCDVALITGTSFIIHTLGPLLEAARGCREVVVLGPSTVLCPHLYQETPVTMLSGVRVQDGESVLQVVSESGGMRQFRPFIEKVSLRLDRAQ